MATTRKKKESNTGFRNGNLFCYNCGNSYDMFAGTGGQGVPIGLSADIMKSFAKQHLKCKPTWTEPVNENAENKTATDNALWWLKYGEHGASSAGIWYHMTKGSYGDMGPVDNFKFHLRPHPLDPSDFYRCYKLLNAVPQWKKRIGEMGQHSEVWQKLVDNWDKLTEMLEEQLQTKKANGMYEFMQQLGC